MPEDDSYDVIVIGAGPVGENAASAAVAGTDRTAALVEAELLGGECSYWACIPSKTLLRPLDVVALAQHLEGVGGDAHVDREALLARRDTWVHGYDDASQAEWADGAGIAQVRGHGRLVGERQVEVTAADGSTRVLTAREAVVLATGSVPVVPGPLAQLHPWTSRDATGVREVPGRVAIVGGGVVACEAARWLRALGAEVTLLVRDDRLLARTEAFAGDAVREALEAEGISVRLGVSVTGGSREGDAADAPSPVAGTLDDLGDLGVAHGGAVTLELDGGDSFACDEVLVATGRRPAVDDLGLDAVGLSPSDLDGRSHGGAFPDWLYAVGDVSGDAPLTHWGKYQATVVGALIADRAAGRPERSVPPVVPVPQVVFTDPQVASVGQTEAEAREAGVDAQVVEVPFTSAAGSALLRDDASGQVRLVIDRSSQTLVGATFVGPECAELLHAATVAIVGQVPVEVLRHAVPSFPTASEVWLRLLEQV